MSMDDDDRYCTPAELARYSTLSVRQLQRYSADREHPLPTHRLGTRVLYRRSEFDTWLRERESRMTSGRLAAIRIRGCA
jgi:predicted DNA-binding transcriptional regulator AlpA